MQAIYMERIVDKNKNRTISSKNCSYIVQETTTEFKLEVEMKMKMKTSLKAVQLVVRIIRKLKMIS